LKEVIAVGNKRRVVILAGVVLAGCFSAAATTTRAPALKTQKLMGRDYVSAADVATAYGLGGDQHRADTVALYRAPGRQLQIEADRRDATINGVRHWLAVPVMSARGGLWMGAVDVEKSLEPVFRPDRLRGSVKIRTIILDPGHGGADRGARGPSGQSEKWFTLDLAKRVQRELDGSGAQVMLTRSSDVTMSLAERVEFCRRNRGDLFVSLHFNSGGTASGIETFCLPAAGTSPTASAAVRPTDQQRQPGNQFDAHNVLLAHYVQEALVKATGGPDRGVRRARFYLLRHISCPAILVEAGFLSNPSEEKKIQTPSHRDRLAKSIAEGILRYKRSVE
jgi:N-acetylmuramoyl-L-alanine amidase